MSWSGGEDVIAEPPASTEELLEFLYLIPVAVAKFRADGSIVLINPAAAALLLPLSGGGELANLFVAVEAVAPDLRRQIETFAAPEGTVIDQQWLSTMSIGRTLVISLTVIRVAADAYLAVLADVTRIAEQDRALFADRAKFQAIFDQLREYAIYTLNLEGEIDEWNRSLERFGGWMAKDVLGRPFSLFWPPGDLDPSMVEALLDDVRRLGSVENDGWRVKRDGSRLWANTIFSALRNNAGVPVGYVVVSRDITDRKLAEDELQKLATLDPLTGAFNRRQGDVLILAEFARQARDQRPFSALMVDIDHFKAVNDRFGHAAGDSVLTALTRCCERVLRAVDMVIRWGGDEFIVLLPGADTAAAMRAAERIRAALARARADFRRRERPVHGQHRRRASGRKRCRRPHPPRRPGPLCRQGRRSRPSAHGELENQSGSVATIGSRRSARANFNA